jgi:hypothetical protein
VTAEHISSLELSWRTREGRQLGGGAYQTQREYLDFVVDGHSLGETLGVAPGGFIGCLGWGESAYQGELVQRLLLARPAELETGRQVLYVCPECGDIGCGAITAVIDQAGDSYLWSQFGLERNYQLDEDSPLFDLSEYAAIGPFRFDKQQYSNALTNWPKRD